MLQKQLKEKKKIGKLMIYYIFFKSLLSNPTERLETNVHETKLKINATKDSGYKIYVHVYTSSLIEKVFFNKIDSRVSCAHKI